MANTTKEYRDTLAILEGLPCSLGGKEFFLVNVEEQKLKGILKDLEVAEQREEKLNRLVELLAGKHPDHVVLVCENSDCRWLGSILETSEEGKCAICSCSMKLK